jgi:tetratricopeptide (TPR) repeat protein
MKILSAIFTVFVLSGLTACAGVQTGGEVQPGRYALRRGDPKAALAHFQRAAEGDPNYVTNFTPLKQGVWTYVGRAHYDAGNLPEARKALERANSLHNDDYMADLYLGLVLARAGDRDAGRKEIETGLVGIHDWLDYTNTYHLDGRYWDPAGMIRSQIKNDLVVLKGKEFDWSDVISRGEYIGNKMETEIEWASRRWRREQKNNTDEPD